MAHVAGLWGDEAVRTLFLQASESGDPIAALQALSNTEVEKLSAAWHDAMRSTYADVLRAGLSPRGRPLIIEEGSGGELNVGPALSPDGERLVFLFEKELFSIEMFLANARTGEVIRELTEFATDPHFDSIQFLQSTGAWSSDSRRFAYATVKAADPVVVIIDPVSGDTIREIALPSLGEVINPTWSPDGRYLAFSGVAGGVSDLFLFDLQEHGLEQATRDCSRRYGRIGRPTVARSRWSPISSARRWSRWRSAITGWASTMSRRGASARCRDSMTRKASIRSGRPMRGPCTSSPIPTASPTSFACRSTVVRSRR